MPPMNNLNFPENMFLHTIDGNFAKQKQHKVKELSIPRE